MSSIRRCDGCSKLIELTDTWKQFEATVTAREGLKNPVIQRSNTFDFCTYECLTNNALNVILTLKNVRFN